MIAIEHRHHMNYYKFVNMFTDVKHLKESAVRRSYLDILYQFQRVVNLTLMRCIYSYLLEAL